MGLSCELHERDILNFRKSGNLIDKHEELTYKYLCKKDTFIIILLEINNLKFYKYMFGYKYKTKLLEQIFKIIEACLGIKGNLFRFEKDIALITLHDLINESEAISIIEKILDIFNYPIDIEGNTTKLSINIGASSYPKDSNVLEEAISYAEIALNYCRKNDNNRYKFFKPKMYYDVIKEGKIEIDILNAINKDELILYYQPQIDINSNKVYGLEALLRWNHPQYGMVSPIYFIDIIEKNEMIRDVGKFVVRESFERLKKLHKEGYNDLTISINISEKQLTDPTFIDFIKHMLKKVKLNPKYVILEITERILINSTKDILAVITMLKNVGLRIFIDDFGTGYSSLNYLYKFSVDGIKIDKTFIDDIHRNQKKLIITKNIIKLAQDIDLEVVAEGVEIIEQLRCLENNNCNKIQGFIFGKPMSKSELNRFLCNFKI